jgi:CheY-like chemotaxis protein
MLHPSKILIVDDEPFNVDYLEQELEDLGYTTVSARNGREALEKVALEAPDLILLDVMMPIMDGLTVCRILKGDDETRLIPIVIMTALDGFDDRITGIEAGADDFLTKPVNQRELLARMQTALRLKHTVDGKLSELRRAKDHFAKFVPEAVKRLVAANPEAPALAKHACDVSVLFLDIAGYTRLCGSCPGGAESAGRTLFFDFPDRIHEAGGDINETAGRLYGDLPGRRRAHAYRHGGADRTRLAGRYRSAQSDQHTPPLAIHRVSTGLAPVGSTRFEGAQGTAGPLRRAAGHQPGGVWPPLPRPVSPGGPEIVRRLGHRYQMEQPAAPT